MTTTAPIDAARAGWRRLFVFYALALTLATHWPRLELPAGTPGGDKLVHFVAFGLLTILLAHAGWLRSRWLVVALALAWAMLDEASQSLPIFGRHFTAEDIAANAAGVVVAGAWLWALRPLGRTANRLRLRRQEYLRDRLAGQGRTWLVLGAVLACCGVPTAIAWLFLSPMGPARLLTISGFVWAMTSAAFTWRLWQHERETMQRDRPCLRCGRPRVDLAPGAMCPGCLAPVHRGQWTAPAPPPPGIQLVLLAWPLSVGLFALATLYVILHLSNDVYAYVLEHFGHSTAPRVARFIGQLPPPLTRTLDLALLLLVFAITTATYRSGLGRYYDRAIGCPRCGHDLRGTPTVNGRGRCGECGAPFERAGRSVTCAGAREDDA